MNYFNARFGFCRYTCGHASSASKCDHISASEYETTKCESNVLAILSQHQADLTEGAVISVTEGQIRRRQLPLL